MKLIKDENEFGHIICLEEDNKSLIISYQGNLDLYWTLHNNNGNINKDNTFIITKENYALFQLFDKLYSNIANIELFDEEELPLYLKSKDDIDEYLKHHEEEKRRYKEYNMSHYNDLFNPKKKKITWYSDETSSKVSNYLEIIKEEEQYRVVFNTQKHIEGYDRDFKSDYSIPIRFRNSGSRYDPFNCIFMKMYNKMDELDDVNDIGHQIQIEEYVYQKKRK